MNLKAIWSHNSLYELLQRKDIVMMYSVYCRRTSWNLGSPPKETVNTNCTCTVSVSVKETQQGLLGD